MIGRTTRIGPTPIVRRTTAWLVATIVWSCSGSTATDAVGSGEIASIEVSPPSSSVAIGAQLPLTAVARDGDGKIVSDASIVWSVQDASVASVSASGVVTGVALGTTQIAASANGKSGLAAITVQKTPVANVIVRPNHVDAVPGMHTQLTAVAYDAANDILSGRTIIWATSNSGVATVDNAGNVTAVAPGTATITGTAEGKSDAATITVAQAPVASVTVTPNPLGMSVGQKTQLATILRDSSGNVLTGRTVTWTSSNTAVATVSSAGEVTAVSAGTTTVTATSEGKSGTAAVTVSNFAVGSVSVQPQGNTIVKGASLQLSVAVKDVNGTVVTDRVVTWSSSNGAVATVNGSGLVTGVGAGTATITATSEGVSGTTTVTVTDPVATVTVTPANDTISTGQSLALTATLKDASGAVLTGRTVTWSTNNASVATVSSSGLVSGVGGGTATITATSEGKSGTASVTVVAAPVGSVVVQPSPASVLVLDTTRLAAIVKDVNGVVVTDRLVTWSSNNTLVATVSQSGLVKGLIVGNATITATSEGKSGSSVVTVSLAPVATVTVAPDSTATIQGQSAQFTATAKDALGNPLNRTIAWSSSNTSIATVDGTGKATAVATFGPSTAIVTITATSEGKSGTAKLVVNPIPVASVNVSPSSATINVNTTKQFSAVALDATGHTLPGRTFTWTSSDATVATVDQTGLVTGKTGGKSATITATSEGKFDSAIVQVKK